MAARKGSGLRRWEYPAGSGIYIREIVNQKNGQAYNGSFQVVVPSKVTGAGRIRKQCSARKEAEAFADEQFSGKKEEGQGYFRVTEEERRQFTFCLPKLREAGIKITEAVEHALKTLHPAGGAKTIDQIVEELIASKRIRYDRGDIAERTFRDFRHRATAFGEQFKGSLASEFQMNGHTALKQWLVEMEVETRTAKNYLNVVAEILKYAIQKRYIVYNPLDSLTDADRKELCGSGVSKEPAILTLEDAKKLIHTALETEDELGLLAAITLGLFCGIRTEEIKRLDWESVKLDERFVVIGSDIAKKRRIRHVTIPENAAKWLASVKRKKGSIVEQSHSTDYQKKFRRLWTEAGFEEWKINAMRHSFGSYHYALHGDSMLTSRELGHKTNDDVLFAHYRSLTTRADGEAFFMISPMEER